MDKNVYRSVVPNKQLAPYVRRFMVADCNHPIREIVHPKPTGYNYMNWHIRGSWQGESVETLAVDGANLFFSGQIDNQHICVTQGGRYQHIVTEFTALGFYQLTGIEGKDIVNLAVPFDQFDCHFTHQAISMLQVQPHDDMDDRLFRLDQFLTSMTKTSLTTTAYLQRAVDEIEAVEGVIKINELCQRLPVSPRQLNRQFKSLVGVTPKTFSRFLQMNRVLMAMMTEEHDYLSTLASEWGYSDQSHLVKTIQDFFNTSPRAFVSSQQETVFAFLANSRSI